MNAEQPYRYSESEISKFRFDETVEIIVQASCKLNCSNIVRAKALTIYHHFKRCVLEAQYESYMIAAGCLSLSAKFYEEPIEFDVIIMSIFSLIGQFPSTLDDNFKKLRKNLTIIESLILRMVEFALDHDLAHQYLIYFIDSVKEAFFSPKARDAFITICMRFADDFYLSGKCLNYKASEIAAVIISASFHYMGFNSSNSGSCHQEWLKKLANVPEGVKCNLIEDIFEVSFLTPVADMEFRKNEDFSRLMDVENT